MLFPWEDALFPEDHRGEESIFWLRYFGEYPLASIFAGTIWGAARSEHLRISEGPLRRRFVARNALIFLGSELAFSLLICAPRALFAVDNVFSRAGAGIATALLTGSFYKSPALGRSLMIPFVAGSIAIHEFENPPKQSLKQKLDSWVSYQRRKLRAQMLLDPKRPDFDEMDDLLREGIK